MLAKIRNIPRIVGRSLGASRVVARPSLSAAEQSRRSWARLIDSYEAVPDPFRGFFPTGPSRDVAFPYAVLTPDYEGFLHRASEQLICVVNLEICVLERTGRSYTARRYPLSSISHVEITTVLLDSRITIYGPTLEGDPGTSTWRFNAVTDYLFIPIVERIRLAAIGSEGRRLRSEADEFDRWRESNYKLMNYAKRSLLGGERVLGAILQPELRSHGFKILGREFYRLVTPAHASILTDRELIFILEGETRSHGERYGGTWRYIPLDKTEDLTVTRQDEQCLVLTVEVAHATPFTVRFSAAAEPELGQFLDRFWEMAASRPNGPSP
jgi:hypothetical protein